jgi:hypothetical protein
MSEQLYTFERDTLIKAINKRNWNSATLAKFSGVHPATLRRLLGEEYPKDMKEDRRDLIRGMTAIKLAFALRERPQLFTPDLPEKPPPEKTPDFPTVPFNPGDVPTLADGRRVQRFKRHRDDERLATKESDTHGTFA